MKILKSTVTIAILLISGVTAFAQNTSESKTYKSIDIAKIKSMLNETGQAEELPAELTWKARIMTNGGIMGNGKGNMVFTSEGNFSSDGIALTGKSFDSETLQRMAQIVSKAQMPEQVKSFLPQINHTSKISLCKDCYTTTLILSRREADGQVKTLIETWDITTKGQVAEDVLQIYESIIQLLNTGK